MAIHNPFAPRFGAVPPVLAGRREIRRDLSLVADGGLCPDRRGLPGGAAHDVKGTGPRLTADQAATAAVPITR